MRVSFPYMGTTIVYGKLLELLGHQVVMPEQPTRKTVELGVKYSPEFACFPFKVIMGTYLETLEKGVDIFVTSGGQGPCRAGFYGELHRKIIQNLGYDIDFIVLDPPWRDYEKFFKQILTLKGETSWPEVIRVVRTVYQMSTSVDKIEKLITTVRAYASDRTALNRSWRDILAAYSQIKDTRGVARVEKEALREIERYNIKLPPEEERIRIGIVGEIYVVMEPSINGNIEEILNSLGAEVERSLYLSTYIDETIFPWVGRKEKKKLNQKAGGYIDLNIGGHARLSVGQIVDFKDRGFDGIIHLKPFACLPELISESMLEKLSVDLDMPILSLSIDEQTAEANIMTRLDAFVDFIKYGKADSKERVSLSG